MSERLSPLDTMFLDLEQVDDGATMHFGAVMVFDPLPEGGTPDIDRVREHVDERLHLPAALSQAALAPAREPAVVDDMGARRRTSTSPRTCAMRRCRRPGGDAELHEWFGDFLSHRLDRRRPLWETVLLDGLAGGRWALATKTHHCLVDGMGSVDVGRAPARRRAFAAAPAGRRPLAASRSAGRSRRAVAPVPGAAGPRREGRRRRAAVTRATRSRAPPPSPTSSSTRS